MSKIEISQTIGVLANIGVLVGILLLVYELTQNRDMMRAQTRESVAQMLVDLLTTEATDPLYTEAQVKRLAGQSLTPAERYRLETLQEAYWRYRESVHYQYRNGLYDEDEYLALRAVWVEDIETDDWYRAIYCRRRGHQTPELTAEIDALLKTPCE